jgi:hypothetical protein
LRLFWDKTDILSSGYAAMDNFRLVASDISGDIGNVSTPEPSDMIGLGILGSGLVVCRCGVGRRVKIFLIPHPLRLKALIVLLSL